MGKNNKMKGGNNFKNFDAFKEFLDKLEDNSIIINNVNEKLLLYNDNFKEKYVIFLIYGLSFLIKNFKSDNLGPSALMDITKGGIFNELLQEVQSKTKAVGNAVVMATRSAMGARNSQEGYDKLIEQDNQGNQDDEVDEAHQADKARQADYDTDDDIEEAQDVSFQDKKKKYLVNGEVLDFFVGKGLKEDTINKINIIMNQRNINKIFDQLINMHLIIKLFELVDIDIHSINSKNIEYIYRGGTINEYNNMQEITNKDTVKDIHNNLLVFMNFLLYLHPNMKHNEFLKIFTIIIYILSIFIDNFQFKKNIIEANLFTNSLENTINAFKLNYVKQIYEEILNV